MKIQRKYTMHADEILEAVQDWLRKNAEIAKISDSDIPTDLHCVDIVFDGQDSEALNGCKLEWSRAIETKDV